MVTLFLVIVIPRTKSRADFIARFPTYNKHGFLLELICSSIHLYIFSLECSLLINKSVIVNYVIQKCLCLAGQNLM